MQTLSSASITYFASASASEWIATVLIPISRQARWIRSAISPRLAIRIFSNMRGLLDHEERLPVLHRLAVFHHDRLDGPGRVRLDLVQELHRLDDAERLALGHRLADLHEGGRAGRRRTVERPHHGRLELVAGGLGRLRLRGCGQGARPRAGRGHGHLLHGGRGHDQRLGARALAADAHLLLTLGDLDLADAGLLDEVDQLLQLAQVHGKVLSSRLVRLWRAGPLLVCVKAAGLTMMWPVSPLFAA